MVAAVDVGILNLTNYKPPSPDDYYLGQRALSADIRDLYGDLIDGMQGARGQIRSGGDEGAQLQGSPPTGPPVALYSGIVTVGADGNAEVAFDVAATSPARCASWRWRGARTKSATPRPTSTVRDPVVLTATLPRFLLPGDRSQRSSRSRQCRRPGGRLHHRASTTAADRRRRRRDAKADAARQRTRRARPFRSPPTPPATAPCGCRSTGPAGFALERSYRACGAAAGANPGAAHGEADRQGRKPDAVERYVCRSRSRHRRGFDFGRRLDGARCGGLLAALDRYPYRCSEQITSRALPLLYVSDLASDAHVAPIRRPISAFATRSKRCSRGRTATARSACGASAATTSGSTPMSPIS